MFYHSVTSFRYVFKYFTFTKSFRIFYVKVTFCTLLNKLWVTELSVKWENLNPCRRFNVWNIVKTLILP